MVEHALGLLLGARQRVQGDDRNLGRHVHLALEELLDLLVEGTHFAPYNTRVTFDENGKLVEFLYTYSPWN